MKRAGGFIPPVFRLRLQLIFHDRQSFSELRLRDPAIRDPHRLPA